MSEKKKRNEDEITIVIRGPKKFRQMFIDWLYSELTEDDFMAECVKPGCSYNLTTTLEPSEEVYQ